MRSMDSNKISISTEIGHTKIRKKKLNENVTGFPGRFSAGIISGSIDMQFVGV